MIVSLMVDENSGGIQDYARMLGFSLKNNNVDLLYGSAKSDIVHYQLGGGSWKVGLRLCKKNDVPSIITLHDVLQRRNLIRNVYPFILKRIFDRVECIILHSQHAKNIFIQKYGNKHNNKIVIIPHGCKQVNLEKDIAREELGIPLNKKIFIVGGLLIPRKGIIDIINAFNKVNEIDYELVIFGNTSPGYLTIMKNAAQGNNRIKLYGFVREAKLEQLYAACDAVIVYKKDSLGETSGILCRAIGARRLIIANDIGNHAEILGNHAEIFSREIDESFMKTIKKVINCSNYNSSYRLDILAERLSWNNIGKMHLELYRSLL